MTVIRTLIWTRATVPGGTCTARSGQMRTAAPIVIGALVLGACGCTASNPPRPAPTPPATRSSAADDMNGMQMSSNAPKQQAVELRTGLEELFGQDVFVGVRDQPFLLRLPEPAEFLRPRAAVHPAKERGQVVGVAGQGVDRRLREVGVTTQPAAGHAYTHEHVLTEQLLQPRA